MRSVRLPNGDTFESSCDMIDVTSLHRPDTSWVHVDAHGHEHRWYVEGGGPDGHHISAGHYNPSAKHVTPTLTWIFERWGYWEDGERYPIGHHECRQCGEHIKPAYKPDDTTQYITGLRYYSINGESVSPDEFKRRWEEAQRG